MSLLLWLGLALAQVDPMSELDATRAEERGVLEQLNALDAELQAVREQREAVSARVAGLEDAVRQKEDVAASAQALLEQRRPQVAVRVAALYRLHRRGLARVLFGAEDPVELRRRSTYLLAILRADLARIRGFNQSIADRQGARQAVEKDRMELVALRAELQLREAELREQRARRLSMLDEIRNRRALSYRAMAEYGQVRAGMDTRLQSYGGSVEEIRSQANRLNPEGNFRALYGQLPWPTTGRLTRRFGPYVDPINGQTYTSSGLEITCEYGTPFRAVFDGQVKLAEFIPGYGLTVAVEHGPYTTVYGHAESLAVSRGQEVRAGTQLGVVGNTGLTDGRSHVLSFEIRYNGAPQDPLPWLVPR